MSGTPCNALRALFVDMRYINALFNFNLILCRRELMLLVGPPKPDSSKDRDQTRFDLNPNCKLIMGLTTLSCKKIILLQKQQQIIL